MRLKRIVKTALKVLLGSTGVELLLGNCMVIPEHKGWVIRSNRFMMGNPNSRLFGKNISKSKNNFYQFD